MSKKPIGERIIFAVIRSRYIVLGFAIGWVCWSVVVSNWFHVSVGNLIMILFVCLEGLAVYTGEIEFRKK